MYQLTNTSSVVLLPSGGTIPNEPTLGAWQEYQDWLSRGNVPLPVSVPTHSDMSATVLAYARSLRATLFTVVDGLQASALVLGNSADASAIEAFKAGLRNITRIDLSAATTDAQMRVLVLTQYKALASAAPASVQLAFAQAVQ